MAKKKENMVDSLSKFVSFVALVLAAGVLLLIGYSLYITTNGSSTPTQDFCGWSTNGECVYDSDCIAGGCSIQLCQSKDEAPAVTTCEWRDCYDASKYGLTCGCVDGKCQWSK